MAIKQRQRAGAGSLQVVQASGEQAESAAGVLESSSRVRRCAVLVMVVPGPARRRPISGCRDRSGCIVDALMQAHAGRRSQPASPPRPRPPAARRQRRARRYEVRAAPLGEPTGVRVGVAPWMARGGVSGVARG